MSYLSIELTPPSKRLKTRHLIDLTPAEFIESPEVYAQAAEKSSILKLTPKKLGHYELDPPLLATDSTIDQYSERISIMKPTITLRRSFSGFLAEISDKVTSMQAEITALKADCKDKHDRLEASHQQQEVKLTAVITFTEAMESCQYILGASATMDRLVDWLYAHKNTPKHENSKTVSKSQQRSMATDPTSSNDPRHSNRHTHTASLLTLADLTCCEHGLNYRHLQYLHKDYETLQGQRNKAAHSDSISFAKLLMIPKFRGDESMYSFWSPVFQLLWGESMEEMSRKVDTRMENFTAPHGANDRMRFLLSFFVSLICYDDGRYRGHKDGGKEKSKPKAKGKGARVTRALAPNEDSAGQKDRVKSFLSCFNSEPKCAAYLGFADLGEWRKFEFSFHVLEYYLVWGKYCIGKPAIIALELIRDLVHDPAECFPADLQDAVKKYGPEVALSNPEAAARLQAMERESNTHYLMATIIYRLTEYLEAYSPKMTIEELQQRQETAAIGFQQLTKRKVPSSDVSSVLMPRLGPYHELGEVDLEKYNRVVNLLRSVAHTVSGSRWKEKMGAKGALERRKLHPSSLPRWMIPEPDVGKLIENQPKSLPSKAILLAWNSEQRTKYSEALANHIRDFVEVEGLSISNAEEYPVKDPRYFQSGPQWRDTVRRQLNFSRLRVEFFTLNMMFSEAKLLVFGPGKVTPWEEIKNLLFQNSERVVFSYTLRPLLEEEDFELEFRGVPIGLQADFRISSDGDIERVSPLPVENPENPFDAQAELENAAFLSGSGATTKRKPVPQSFYPPEKRDIMLHDHDGYDVWTKEGLRAWQTHAIDIIAGDQPKLTKEPTFRGPKKITPTQRKELQELQSAGESAALSADADAMESTGRHYQMLSAFTGSESQVGPMVDPCKVALGMRTVGKHGQLKILDQSTCDTLPDCKGTFLDSQITGAAFMLQRSYGYIPVDKARAEDSEVAKACESLKSIKTGGGFLVDATGFGKTDTACLFAAQHGLYGDHSNGHKPMLLVVPNGAVFGQWASKLRSQFPSLNLIISNEDRPSETKYLSSWVSSTAMREAPEKLDNWPAHLRYVFDTSDPRASKTIVLTPYDSHSSRTVGIEWVDKHDPAKKAAMAVPALKGKYLKREKAKMRQEAEANEKEPIFVSRWKGRFRCVILDEGHKVRHPITKLHASILLLEADINWFLTATPVINSAYDILGGLHILWVNAKKALAADKDAMNWLKDKSKLLPGYELFGALKDIPFHDIRRLVAMDPTRIRTLFETQDVTKISEYYHYLDELVAVRRSTASELVRNETGEKVSLASMMPVHEVKTVELSYTEEEEVEAQVFHRIYARYALVFPANTYHHTDFHREYVEALKGALEANEAVQLGKVGPDTRKDVKKIFPPITGPSRRLALTAKATKLARLDERMRQMGLNTLVKDMEGYRAAGHTVDWLVEMTRRDGDVDPKTRIEKVQFLAEGSPTLRYLLSHIRDTYLNRDSDPDGHPNKVLLTEDTPLVAWYWELILNYLYIETEALHSGLSNAERIALVDRFKDGKNSLAVLIQMYNVGAQGTNLDESARLVLVATGALNASLEIQAWGRLIRVREDDHLHPFQINLKQSANTTGSTLGFAEA
ncbi:MAG: hypothetical protein Q9170_000983 [Blastenia crenularia]